MSDGPVNQGVFLESTVERLTPSKPEVGMKVTFLRLNPRCLRYGMTVFWISRKRASSYPH